MKLNNKLKSILRLPEKIPADKRLHALIGVVLMSPMLMLTSNLYTLLGVLIGVAYGIEFFQKLTKSGQFDHYDALAVIIGGLIVLAPYLIKGI